MKELFRALPSVDQALRRLQAEKEYAEVPRLLLRQAVVDFLDDLRLQIKGKKITQVQSLTWSNLWPGLESQVRRQVRPHFRWVINATGVVVHTNLGRSLLARDALLAVERACSHYSNLEFSLAKGQRGSRYSHVQDLLTTLTGAEAALVVNNNAAAVLLVLESLAKGKEVIVSRGQLVEIGGSFRIPDVMAKSGARLKEVGTTNRTHLADYEQAISSETGALLKVHTSNYKVIGFHKEVPLQGLASLGQRHGLPVIEDLGSGNFFDFSTSQPLGEPTAQSALKDGAALITFSGDKLLGGPQSGIILGQRRLVDRIKKNPLNRALRIDKMTLAALEATLRLYLDPDKAREEIPTLKMITMNKSTLQGRAKRLAADLRRQWGSRPRVQTKVGVSRVGGGASPGGELPTSLVQISMSGQELEHMRQALLQTDPPLVGRVEDQSLCLDPRTIQADELRLIPGILDQAWQAASREVQIKGA